MSEETSEEKILRIVLSKVDEDNIAINRRIDSMRDILGGSSKSLEGRLGLVKGEILDFRHCMDSKLDSISEDLKMIRKDMNAGFEKTKEEMQGIYRLMKTIEEKLIK